jgi:hypothetical protein
MNLHLDWGKPLVLKDATRDNMIYRGGRQKIAGCSRDLRVRASLGPGQFETLYVGKANRLKWRVRPPAHSRLTGADIDGEIAAI